MTTIGISYPAHIAVDLAEIRLTADQTSKAATITVEEDKQFVFTLSFYNSDSFAGTQDFLRCKPRIAPVTLSIFPAEHEPSLTNTTA